MTPSSPSLPVDGMARLMNGANPVCVEALVKFTVKVKLSPSNTSLPPVDTTAVGAASASNPLKLSIARPLMAMLLSISPTLVSNAQSPPALVLPVSLLEAATSAPVQRASSVTRVCPAAPAPTSQPYNWMSAPSVRLARHCSRFFAKESTLSELIVRLPKVNCPDAPWDMT
ncbi:hypothetical protein D3C87_1317570 [compost metagenome]